MYRPGDTCPKTGTYKVFNKEGKKVNTASLKKGETFPPTPHSGEFYENQK